MRGLEPSGSEEVASLRRGLHAGEKAADSASRSVAGETRRPWQLKEYVLTEQGNCGQQSDVIDRTLHGRQATI